MAIVQPNETPTQDFRERDAALSVTAHTNHSANELYFSASEFGGSGTYDHADDLPSYGLGNNEHADITHMVPSYWWNGQVKVEVIWVKNDAASEGPDLDMELFTWAIGGSAVRTTVIGKGVGENGADFSEQTTDGTNGKLYEDDVWSDTDQFFTKEDDVFHLRITADSGKNVGIVAIAVEYYPNFEQ